MRLAHAFLLLFAGTAPGSHLAADPTIAILSRETAPGEPLRIRVASGAPLASVEGELFGEPLWFQPESGDGRQWSAWAAVSLDRPPGSYSLSVRASSADGAPATASVALRIDPKKFPEQHLTVQEKYVRPSDEAQARIARERRRLDALYARRSGRPSPGEPFAKPVDGEPTSRFGLRRFFNGEPRSPHSGLDLRAPEGTKVHASGHGEVVLAGDLYFSGKTVILDHGGGLFTIYAHLSRVDVTEGAHVPKGAVLGLSGATGRVTGPHLHWGARVGPVVVDPRALLDPALFALSPGQ